MDEEIGDKGVEEDAAVRDESRSPEGIHDKSKVEDGSKSGSEAQSVYPDIFDTADEYESAIDNQQPTAMEVRINAHKSQACAKLTAKSKAGNVVKFYDQQVVTLKVPKKLRIGAEKNRLPVRVLTEKRTNAYTLICSSGQLHGLYPHQGSESSPAGCRS